MKTTDLKQLVALQETIELAQKQIDELTNPKPTFEYPLYFKHTYSGIIVKFTALQCREAIANPLRSLIPLREIGFFSDSSIPHTNDQAWEEIPYNREHKLYDKQPVLVQDSPKHLPQIRFYDALNNNVFDFDGSRNPYYGRQDFRPLLTPPPAEIQDWANTNLED